MFQVIYEKKFNDKYNWVFHLGLFEHLEIELQFYFRQSIKDHILTWCKNHDHQLEG